MQTDPWNVVVTVYQGELKEAMRLLAPFGQVRRTDYWNVLAVEVEDIVDFLDKLESTLQEDASIANSVSRIIPVTRTFRFSSREEFEQGARRIVEQWTPELEGKTFHVRMHRRGFKGRLSSQHEEQFLDHYLLDDMRLRASGARIGFEDPDVIIAVETIGQIAGLSRWTRERLDKYELLKLD